MTRRFTVALVALAALVVVVAGASVDAQSQVSGPTVVPERYELRIGERVRMTLDGFTARGVTMVFCGNDGRRGSVDCNMRGGQGREINQDGTPTPAEMEVAEPPAPCPCIIRVSSQDNREIAVAPVTLVGHPVADVEGGTEFVQALAVDIDATESDVGVGDGIRSSLGGPTAYDVTVEVRNQATFVVDDVRATASFNRLRYDDVRNVVIENPGTLQPGEVWTQTVQVEIPSLTFGDVEWRIDATGAGPPVTAVETTVKQPILLYVVGLLLLADLLFLLWRFVARRLRRRGSRRPAETEDRPFAESPVAVPVDDAMWMPPGPPPSAAVTTELPPVDGADAEQRQPEPVG